MQQLQDILYGVALVEVYGNNNITINDVVIDSREAKPQSLFVAIKGIQTDGHQYIKAVIQNGATAIVCEELPNDRNDEVVYLKVKNSNDALAIVAKNFYQNPSASLKLVGITGTNGKSTIVTLLYNLFNELGYCCGLISTIVYKIDQQIIDATHTTPNILKLNQLLQKMVNAGCEYCFMEVSSHAMIQGRTDGITFTGGVFTNITHDHLDYHLTFDNYLAAKKSFFDALPAKAFALTNVDDKRGKVMLQNTKAKKYTYGLKSMADFKAKILENSLTGLLLNINNIELNTMLVGAFNAYNILAVYAVAALLEADEQEVLTKLSSLKAVEGRFEHLYDSENKIIGIVDYAHTPDALKNVLETIADLRTGNEKVISVIGAGGDRDKAKRPKMTSITCSLSDKVILTSDNPRSEEIEDIINDMMEGLSPIYKRKVVRIANRKEAIQMARYLAEPGDIIGIYGKGHEKYQEIKNVKHPFDDKQVLLETFKNFRA